ncbi:MAG: hypothetical protein A2Y25_07630 [Candidatus Melainabacteria bacterium GWF2_37_15]|nr:MAG: hypothetical protein A2Y25_07630 [Candidatus Melainabacteria bacterium GWF2_37_15]
MINHLKNNQRFVFLFVSIGFIVSIFYSFIVFKPVYKSTSTILTDDPTMQTQIYVLKSGKFARKVWKAISEKYELDANNEQAAQNIKKTININNPENTNILIITAEWDDPIIARDLVSAFVSVYHRANPDSLILDNPNIPVNSSFPGRLELVALITLFSGLLAVVSAILKSILKDNYHSAEQIEQDFNVPILGVIPWLDQEVYDEPDIMFAIDESASYYSLAFQKAVSCLKLRGHQMNKRVFAFTSTEFSKFRSTMIMNIGYSLSRAGKSVVVVDADFRTPSIGKDLGLKMESNGDLTELLTVLSEEMLEKGKFADEKVDYYTYSIPGVNNFFIIPNSGHATDPSSYLHSDAFSRLIQELKLNYDWVLVDMPPALAVPDAIIVGSYVDGVILISGLEAEKSVLKAITKQFKTYEIDIFGIITREFQTQEAASANKYIKQMISKLMSRNEGLITE